MSGVVPGSIPGLAFLFSSYTCHRRASEGNEMTGQRLGGELATCGWMLCKQTVRAREEH